MDTRLMLNHPLENILQTKCNNTLKKIAWMLAGVFLLAFAAQLSIPLQPVPLTFQSATVILIGMAYGPVYGCGVIACYYLAAIAGLPVLADWNFGLQHFYGPTGGYLLGFLPAAWLSGFLAQKGFARNIVLSFLATLAGTMIIFLCGITVLSQFIGSKSAFLMGVCPFIFSETAKMAAIAAITPRLWKDS